MPAPSPLTVCKQLRWVEDSFSVLMDELLQLLVTGRADVIGLFICLRRMFEVYIRINRNIFRELEKWRVLVHEFNYFERTNSKYELVLWTPCRWRWVSEKRWTKKRCLRLYTDVLSTVCCCMQSSWLSPTAEQVVNSEMILAGNRRIPRPTRGDLSLRFPERMSGEFCCQPKLDEKWEMLAKTIFSELEVISAVVRSMSQPSSWKLR